MNPYSVFNISSSESCNLLPFINTFKCTLVKHSLEDEKQRGDRHTECYCRSIQRRDYRREVALSHLTAQTETYLSHHNTIIPQIGFIGNMNWEDSSAMYRCETFLLVPATGASLCWKALGKHRVTHRVCRCKALSGTENPSNIMRLECM